MRRVTQLYDQALAPSDLRVTQYSLLSQIERRGPIALNQLADAIVMDRATLGHNVRPLQARGLVDLCVSADRRSREISLTKKGKQALDAAKKYWRQAQSTFEKQIGHEDAAALRSVLHRVAATNFFLADAGGDE